MSKGRAIWKTCSTTNGGEWGRSWRKGTEDWQEKAAGPKCKDLSLGQGGRAATLHGGESKYWGHPGELNINSETHIAGSGACQ